MDKPMEGAKAPGGAQGFSDQMICEPCGDVKIYKWKIGKLVASSLAGLVAGVVIAVIVLLPWMVILGKLCPTGKTI